MSFRRQLKNPTARTPNATNATGSSRNPAFVPGMIGTGCDEHFLSLVDEDTVVPSRVQAGGLLAMNGTVKTESWVPGLKLVGCPWFCEPGEKELLEPTGIVCVELELLL